MNVLEHYVTEIIGEPYYDDYGSGNYHWWLKVKALCYWKRVRNNFNV